ncbi:hypothetical protein BDD12DRAFT_882257 [Trichophaea hybrida]|nr:hypothetical protein BDD12DRAFT_882257 [Trichophaea hybrida]
MNSLLPSVSVLFSCLLSLTAAQSGVLNFEDILIPNTSNCGYHIFLSSENYHGFHISALRASPGAWLHNTTQTQYCHESSSGAGPWLKAVSKPNVLQGYGGELTFKSAIGKDFGIKALSMATHDRSDYYDLEADPKVVVTYTGWDKKGKVVKAEQRVYHPRLGDGTGPWKVQLKGFGGLRKVRVAARWRFKVKGDMRESVERASVYVDDVKYGFV